MILNGVGYYCLKSCGSILVYSVLFVIVPLLMLLDIQQLIPKLLMKLCKIIGTIISFKKWIFVLVIQWTIHVYVRVLNT